MRRTKNIITAITLGVFAVIFALSSCKTQRIVETTTIYQTDTIREQRDSVVIREVLVPVEFPVPEVRLVDVVAKDTTSVLQSDLYKSTAWISGGLLHHTLESLPDARLQTEIAVSDTTRSSQSSQTIRNNTQKTDVQQVEVNRLTTLQTFFFWSGKVFWALFLLGLIIFVCLHYCSFGKNS